MKNNSVITKVPRPSRALQMGTLKHFENRFSELAQSSCSNAKNMTQTIYKIKELLLDMRHVIVYHSFDHDIREKMFSRADSIINYMNAYLQVVNAQINVEQRAIAC